MFEYQSPYSCLDAIDLQIDDPLRIYSDFKAGPCFGVAQRSIPGRF